ncbi:MAG TPA: DUF3667 domain-containing protein [Chitinophagaceae bacterium]|nr:DUF3667 domain-containing protein [Chitinophagaceae bacterium]HRF20236.1 DUF3667 domain-containing protein [Chitinophagaceae bacterium]
MSHTPQRKEKDCLNCGTIVQGKYCQNCGQENIVPHETFWHMVKHFLYDITHFDSKFFDSMKYLLLRPGFLPQEYIKGRRASYLNPVKKYVFTSAIFFLLFFSFFLKKDTISINVSGPVSSDDKVLIKKFVEDELAKDTGNMKWKDALIRINDTATVLKYSDVASFWSKTTTMRFGNKIYRGLAHYDSVQKILPSKEKDGWLRRIGIRKILQVNEKYKDDPRTAFNKLRDSVFHKLPYLLFVSLPLFALILKLLYFRHKDLYYVDHGIFSIYHYIFTFILLLFVFAMDKLNNLVGWSFLETVMGLVFLSGGFYLYKSMRKFYKQKRAKTILKFLLLNIAGLVMMAFLFSLFVLFSVFEI